ncbi:Uncharacterised protein [uncultured archaeon]|nr:Uncharacterised protein [uncultured archaeon]
MKKLILFLTVLLMITTVSARIEQHAGFPVNTGSTLKTRLVVQDINGDGKPEIIAAPENRMIKVFNHMGVLEWENTGGKNQADEARVPLVANISGGLEIISYGNPGYSDATFYIWDTMGNNLVNITVGKDLMISSPSITKEGIILAGAAPGTSLGTMTQSTGVYAFDIHGNKLWYLELGRAVNYKAPIPVGDIDGDGIDEAVILTQDINSANPIDGKIWVIKVNSMRGTILWSRDLGGDARSAQINDFDGNGMNEVIVTSSSGTYIFDKSGNQLYKFNINSNLASPGTGIIDGTGVIGAAVTSNDEKKVYLIINGSLKEFSSIGRVDSNLALGDINNDGKMEIAAGDIYGDMYIWDNQGNVLENTRVTNDMFTSATIADLDGDGNKEIILGNSNGNIYAYTYKPADSIPPTTTDDVDGQWHNGGVAVTLTAEDNESGVAATYYTIDGTEPTVSSTAGTTFSISNEGIYTIKYFSVDKAGNVEGIKTAPNQVKIDKTLPLTTDSADGQWHNGSVTVTLTAEDNESGVAATYYTIDGTEPTVSSTAGATFSISNEGIYTIKYFSVDKAGNVEGIKTAPNQVKIDKTSPLTTDNTDGQWHNTDVTVKLTALDNLSHVKYTFSTYHKATTSASTLLEKLLSLLGGGTGIKESVTSKDENVSLSDEGIYDIQYYSEDNANNIETEKASKLVKIDKTSPVTEATLSGSLGSSCYSTDVGVTLAANDAMSGVANMLYDMDGTGWMNYAGKFSIHGEGTHLLKYRSVDNAGNNEVEHNMGFTIDKTPPEAIIGFDPVSKDIKVYNSETGAEESYSIQYLKNYFGMEEPGEDKGWDQRQYTLKDCADNSMVLQLKYKKEGNEVMFKVISMQYNGGGIIVASKNSVDTKWSEEKNGTINELDEKIEAETLFNAGMKYSAKKNQTEIYIKGEGQNEQKETRAGVAILELLTNRDGLKIRY